MKLILNSNPDKLLRALVGLVITALAIGVTTYARRSAAPVTNGLICIVSGSVLIAFAILYDLGAVTNIAGWFGLVLASSSVLSIAFRFEKHYNKKKQDKD